MLGAGYQLRGLRDLGDSKEDVVEGLYYGKNVDVSIRRDNAVIGVVSVKFIMSNYRQNAINYFESQMGETANLRRNNFVFGHILCVTNPMPYRNRAGDTARIEKIRDTDIEKYHKLSQEHSHAHAPNVQALCVFKLDDSKKKIKRMSNREDLSHVSDESFDMLAGSLAIDRFFRVFASLVENKYEEVKVPRNDLK